MYKGSVLSHFLFAVVVDVFIELARGGVFHELLFADYLVLMSGTIEEWKASFESKSLNVSLGKPM